MNISVKVLKGDECTVTVSPETSVLELKHQVEKILKIPVAYQKILLLGKALLDENKISAYSSIKDGSKLTLVIKKPDPIKDAIFKGFRKYYTEQQSQKLTTEFLLDFDKRIKQFSLDDIERIATAQLILQE